MNVDDQYFFYRKMFSKMKFCLKITRFEFYIGLREEIFFSKLPVHINNKIRF